MLSACSTPDFFKFSGEFYGMRSSFCRTKPPPPACHLARTVADEIGKAVADTFADEAPEVLVVDELSANALAGPKRIRIRRTACS